MVVLLIVIYLIGLAGTLVATKYWDEFFKPFEDAGDGAIFPSMLWPMAVPWLLVTKALRWLEKVAEEIAEWLKKRKDPQ